MSFYERYREYKNFDFEAFLNKVSEQDIIKIIGKERLTELEFLMLLSKRASNFLEPMAQKARKLTIQNF